MLCSVVLALQCQIYLVVETPLFGQDTQHNITQLRDTRFLRYYSFIHFQIILECNGLCNEVINISIQVVCYGSYKRFPQKVLIDTTKFNDICHKPQHNVRIAYNFQWWGFEVYGGKMVEYRVDERFKKGRVKNVGIP